MDTETVIQDVETGAENIAGTVVQTLGHISSIGSAVGSVLSGILAALPIHADTKADLQGKIDSVTGTVAAVDEAVSKFEVAPPVVEIKASDLTAAVDKFLSTPEFTAHVGVLVDAAVAKAMADADAAKTDAAQVTG